MPLCFDIINESDLLRVLKEHIIRKRNVKSSIRGMSYVSHFGSSKLFMLVSRLVKIWY